MTAFLKQVAQHYQAEGTLERKCFVFPNRRALVFFKKYLAEEVLSGGKVQILPSMYTINDFFYTLCGAANSSDRIVQLENLYDCYAALYPGQAESLDEFIFWGGVILSDFNDVDKYLADPQKLYTNVTEFKKMQDVTMDYLSETQREAMKLFLRNFDKPGEYKERFCAVWDIMYPLYVNFNKCLKDKGLNYEGMVYRSLAQRLEKESAADILQEVFPDKDKFVFVGLNALNECEKKLMRKMRDASLADFCWDYQSSWIKDKDNKSSFFMNQNVVDFPQAFPLEAITETPSFNKIFVPSGVGQAKQIPFILKECSADINTALVLSDENLLLPVLNSIPEDVKDLNVTMGYPLSASQLSCLMQDICAMQMHLRQKDGKWYFYHQQVWSIFSNSIVRKLLGEEGTETVKTIHEKAAYYINECEFGNDPILKAIFRPIVQDPSSRDVAQLSSLKDYLQAVLSAISPRLLEMSEMSMELDFAKEYYLALERLGNDRREMLPATWIRLVGQLVATSSVPFRGEPLKGLQIMGPLETRALDFENLVIFNCNEGCFPRHNVSSSFIPPELRKGFDLPTYEYQDAVWAYYFYRMIQRAKNVWMVVDSRTEGVRNGEESRYIKQLEMHFGVQFNKYGVNANIGGSQETQELPKTESHIETIKSRPLSASALQTYLACPAKFFYSYVERLKASDEVSEALDAGMFGTVFHNVMNKIYEGENRKIEASYLKSFSKKKIEEMVKEEIISQMKCFEVVGRNLIYSDIICRYVSQVLQADLRLMETKGVDHFTIIQVEQRKYITINGFKFVGVIDRLDSFTPGEVRVVDYKTGRVSDEDFLINEGNAEQVVDALFGCDNKKRPKIALQLYIYDLIAPTIVGKDKDIVNSIYHTGRLFVKDVEEVSLCDSFCNLMNERLKQLLDEISDTSKPFTRTADIEHTCKNCDFKQICGR